jgi:hypothetical protein
MTYLVDVCNDAISLRLSLTSEQFTGPAGPVTVLKLPIPLGFACKARNLSELGGGELHAVYVFKRIDMDPLGFDAFASNLCRDTDWLEGLCLALPVVNARACVMVVAAGRPILFIDTQGYSYARYVARLG